MNGLLPSGDAIATSVGAVATIVVAGGLLGERRLFAWSQHLFAGLVTGYLVLLAVSEVLVPRVLKPLIAAPGDRLDLWLALGLVVAAAGAPWLPRAVVAIPMSVMIGSLAAFALGGAVVGTILPQLAATIVAPDTGLVASVTGVVAAGITGLVLLGFLHGAPRGRLVGGAASAGRWLMLAGIGGWLGYLLFSRLILMVDRIGFLVGDWLGLGR